ncbi:MAG: molybdopterin converting factor subunit 1 [Dehalococcoidia bacterium]|nr:molybdopterin converting factor subunit 1 [Dehalococcoidia bacterium]
MVITVLFFASLADAVGTRELSLAHMPGDTVASVRDRLIAAHPQVSEFTETLLYAVDEEYADEDAPVPAGATLALIPPVSGG